MNIVDIMLEYRKTGNEKLLLNSDYNISKENLNCIVLEILSWLKLENKRTMWMAQGRKTQLKSLQLNMKYSWCVDLCLLVEKEKLFQEYFVIKEGKLDFSDSVPQNIRLETRELAYKNYNPPKQI